MFTETIPLSQIKARRFVNKKELIEKVIFQVQVLIFFALKSIFIYFFHFQIHFFLSFGVVAWSCIGAWHQLRGAWDWA